MDSALLRSPRYRSLLANISLDLYGGETACLLHAAKGEATALLQLLSSTAVLKGRREGSVRVNGMPMGGRGLWARIAYVSCQEEEEAGLTVKETLRFTAAALRPTSRAFSSHAMVQSPCSAFASQSIIGPRCRSSSSSRHWLWGPTRIASWAASADRRSSVSKSPPKSS